MASQEKAAPQRGRRTAPRPGKASESAAPRHGTSVPIPFIVPNLKVYRLELPGPGKVLSMPLRGVSQAASAGRRVTGRLPSAERTMFLGGLGAAAVFGVLEWPVAAAIGIGTMIARRAMGRQGGRSSGPDGSRPGGES